MKKIIFTLVLLATTLTSSAAYLENVPQTLIQPNGDTLRCFATGDEYYHRLHDRQGYTIVQDPQTGYYVYGVLSANGELVPSQLIAGRDNPISAGLTPNLMISQRAYDQRMNYWNERETLSKRGRKSSGDITHGTLNNIIICIRFADDEHFGTDFTELNNMMNDSSQMSESVWAYYRTVSYGQLRVITHILPGHEENRIITYQDSLPRCYFQPYNAYSNPNGYTDQATTEFALIERAMRYINRNHPLPDDINIDINNDGEVDNIVFLVSGGYTGWSDLLWPHKWSLWGHDVKLRDKSVITFNLMLTGAGQEYYSASTFCHEMFHSMGAPDLYRYYYSTNITPVGNWDLMSNNTRPPQHMGAWLKYHVAHWLDSIPTITKSGIYTLRSLGDAAPAANTCYRIPSPDPNQFYLLEYRDREERFERTLSNKGLIITRIDTRFDGNAGYNPSYGIYDGSWIFRPGSQGTNLNGMLNNASFSPSNNRTEFSSRTDPWPFLTDGTIDTSFSITHVSEGGEELTFCLEHPGDCNPVDDLRFDSITTSSAHLSWQGSHNHYIIYIRNLSDSTTDEYISYEIDSNYLDIYDLESNSSYEWYVLGVCDHDTSISLGKQHFRTHLCDTLLIDTIGTSNSSSIHAPFSITTRYGYTQQLYMPEELPGPMDITEISFYYNGYNTISKMNTQIFLGNVEKRYFENQINYINTHSMHYVFHGEVVMHHGWNTIQLDKPFYYDGENSLVFAVHDNSGITASASNQFACMRCDSNRVLSFYSNTHDPNPYNCSSFQGDREVNRSRNIIIFSGCSAEPGRIVPPDPPQVRIDDTPRRDLRVWSEGERIHIVGAEGGPLYVYDLMGRKVYSARYASENECITVPSHGLYLIRTASAPVKKVMVLK